MTAPSWWTKPRRITVLVDNPSWILPYAEELVTAANAEGDHAHLARSHDEMVDGAVCFFLGCTQLAPDTVLARNHRNLVVHESDLPHGRGFAPLTWQILEGCSEISICLLEARAAADAGPVVIRDVLRFAGHELNNELRDAQGKMSVELCLRYLRGPEPLEGVPQEGSPTAYRRRTPTDSRLDPDKSIGEQFDLLRVADNERYPAFFDFRGHRYRLRIEKVNLE